MTFTPSPELIQTEQSINNLFNLLNDAFHAPLTADTMHELPCLTSLESIPHDEEQPNSHEVIRFYNTFIDFMKSNIETKKEWQTNNTIVKLQENYSEKNHLLKKAFNLIDKTSPSTIEYVLNTNAGQQVFVFLLIDIKVHTNSDKIHLALSKHQHLLPQALCHSLYLYSNSDNFTKLPTAFSIEDMHAIQNSSEDTISDVLALTINSEKLSFLTFLPLPLKLSLQSQLTYLLLKKISTLTLPHQALHELLEKAVLSNIHITHSFSDTHTSTSNIISLLCNAPILIEKYLDCFTLAGQQHRSKHTFSKLYLIMLANYLSQNNSAELGDIQLPYTSHPLHFFILGLIKTSSLLSDANKPILVDACITIITAYNANVLKNGYAFSGHYPTIIRDYLNDLMCIFSNHDRLDSISMIIKLHVNHCIMHHFPLSEKDKYQLFFVSNLCNLLTQIETNQMPKPEDVLLKEPSGSHAMHPAKNILSNCKIADDISARNDVTHKLILLQDMINTLNREPDILIQVLPDQAKTSLVEKTLQVVGNLTQQGSLIDATQEDNHPLIFASELALKNALKKLSASKSQKQTLTTYLAVDEIDAFIKASAIAQKPASKKKAKKKKAPKKSKSLSSIPTIEIPKNEKAIESVQSCPTLIDSKATFFSPTAGSGLQVKTMKTLYSPDLFPEAIRLFINGINQTSQDKLIIIGDVITRMLLNLPLADAHDFDFVIINADLDMLETYINEQFIEALHPLNLKGEVTGKTHQVLSLCLQYEDNQIFQIDINSHQTEALGVHPSMCSYLIDADLEYCKNYISTASKPYVIQNIDDYLSNVEKPYQLELVSDEPKYYIQKPVNIFRIIKQQFKYPELPLGPKAETAIAYAIAKTPFPKAIESPVYRGQISTALSQLFERFNVRQVVQKLNEYDILEHLTYLPPNTTYSLINTYEAFINTKNNKRNCFFFVVYAYRLRAGVDPYHFFPLAKCIEKSYRPFYKYIREKFYPNDERQPTCCFLNGLDETIEQISTQTIIIESVADEKKEDLDCEDETKLHYPSLP